MIIDIMELDYIKKIAISTAEKNVQIWDFFNERHLLTIDCTNGGIHTFNF